MNTLRRAFAAAALVTGGSVFASDALVTGDWLEDRLLEDPSVRVFEVSVEPGKFERGHIPGAINLRWHTDLVDPVRRDIVSQDDFEKLLSRAGVDENTTIVLYGDHNNWFAAWGAWVFAMYGLEDNVKLLDGGRNKWEADKRPLSTRQASYTASDFRVTETRPELRARIHDVLPVAEGESDIDLVDIRSPDEYSGRIFAPPGVQELAIRAGHVPGAVNVPWNKAVADDGTFLPREELEALYAEQGITGDKPIIVYCRIGERSSHTWFALSRILGYEVKNYDGSWTEYGNAVGVPIANPAGTVWGGT